MKLSKAIHLFLQSKPNPATRATYQYVLKPMVEYVGPARPVKKIKPVDLIEYSVMHGQRGLAEATVYRDVKSIKVFFNWCVRADLIKSSPADAIPARRLSDKFDRSKAMTDDELEKILDYVKWKPRDHCLILFLADTGCRAGGAAGLMTDHLDVPGCQAVVTEKGDKTRPVAFGAECGRVLAQWLLSRPKDAGAYVFNHRGKKIKSAAISQIVQRAALKVLGYSRGSHSLRHRKGHQMADAGTSIKVASRVMGHSSAMTTLRYYPNDWDRVKEAIDDLAYKPASATEKKPVIVQFPRTRNS